MFRKTQRTVLAATIRLLTGAAVLATALTAMLAIAPARAADSFRVRYLSSAFVYLDGGESEGLAAGDTLLVSRDGAAVAMVVVEHVDKHSASCRIVAEESSPRAGDEARLALGGAVSEAATLEAETNADTAADAPTAPPAAVPTRAAGPAGAPWADLKGYAAVQWYHFNDRGDANLDFDQPTLRLHLTARKLGGRDLTLRVKARARHDSRSRSYNHAVPEDEWSNRVYALSLSSDNPDAALNWQVGRIVSNAIAATGPVDGALVEKRLSPMVRAGAFAGTLPDWRDTAPRSALQKYGLFVRATRGEYGERRWSGAFAGTAEYKGGTISRQYLYLQSDWRSGRRWNLYQSLEFDLNSAWRKESVGESVSLSNLYLSAGYRPSGRASLGLSYDNRRNVRTWDNRALPDSLFDDAFRHGLRARANVKLGKRLTAFANAGWRHRQGDAADTWSWSGGLARDNFLAERVRLSAQASGFDSRWASGWNPSLQLTKMFLAGHSLGVSGGAYLYKPEATGEQRTNGWARLEGTRRFARRFYVTGHYELDWGDDVEGDRLLMEAGLNF